MPFFFKTKRHDTRDKDDWRRNVDAAVGDLRPTDMGFPWTLLQEFTRAYVERRGSLTQEQIDDHLKDLIKTHTETAVAFAACANAMSAPSVRRFLTESLSIGHNGYFGSGLVPCLQAIIAANHVKPKAASRVESDWAFELIEDSKSSFSEESLGKRLQRIISLSISEMSADFLLRDHAIALARRICQNFASQLETLRAENRWVDAFVAVEWLPRHSAALIDLSAGSFGPVQLLDSCFPTWRAWAAWRPNMSRLRFLETEKVDQHGCLRDLLAIDGPDFTNSGETSLKEGLIAQMLIPQHPSSSPQTIGWGNIRVELAGCVAIELRAILDRLSSSIDAACQGGPDYVALLSHLCTRGTISYHVAQILEGVDSLPQNLIGPVLQVYTKIHDEATVRKAFNQVLPALTDFRTRSLRDSLRPYMVTSITNYVLKKQSELYQRLQCNKPWDGTEVDLIDFAKDFPRTSWLWPALDPPVRAHIFFLATGPSFESIKDLGALRIYIQNASPRNDCFLIKRIDAYYKSLMFSHCDIDPGSRELVKALVTFWQESTDGDRRNLALRIARCEATDMQLSCQRISQIMGLEREIVSAVLAIFTGLKENKVASLFEFSRLLVTKTTPEIRASWRMILYYEIRSQGEHIFDHALTTLTAERWFQWLQYIESLFQDMMDWYSPTLLKPETHTWAKRLRPYLPTLESLEHIPVLPCLLKGYSVSMNQKIEQILIWIKETQGIHRRKIIDIVIADLDESGSNAGEIERELATISETTSKGVEACINMLHVCQEGAMEFAGIYLRGLLRSPDLSVVDHQALVSLGTRCGLHVVASCARSGKFLDVAADYFAENSEELLAEAQRLESLRLSLCAVDRGSVSKLLAKLHIEPPSSFHDMLATLPVTIVDMVERVGEKEIELRFPIMNLSMLQKHAMAAGEAESIFVRLKFGPKGIPNEFCIHLAGTGLNDTREHTPWNVSRGNAPQQHFCYGQPSRGVYQLSRILWRHLRKRFVSVENIYSFIRTSIPDMSRSCIVCGIGSAQLQRSTICQKVQCCNIFSYANCEILLADIWQNPTVADLLITMVNAAAMSGNVDLLTNCILDDATQVLNLLCRVPTVGALKKHLSSCINVHGDSFKLDKALMGYSSTPDQLRMALLWACNGNRGFLIPAVNQFRIPSFGAHQFLLANASPELEIAFGTHFKSSQSCSRILFHGTSFDRLHAILCQGLKVLSKTPLMRHAAARGSGVYTADEPATAWSYAEPTPCGSAGSGWKHSSFSNHRVLLGCELAGEKPGKDGIHVITDPTRLMVRYVFLLEPKASMPRAKDVRPAMQSVFASLRSGAV